MTLIYNSFEEYFGEPICEYTRAQAIEDGVLIDVTEVAWRMGILPGASVGVTAGLWAAVDALIPQDANLRRHRLVEVIESILFQAFERHQQSGRIVPDGGPDEFLWSWGTGAALVTFTIWACWNAVEGWTIMLPSDY